MAFVFGVISVYEYVVFFFKMVNIIVFCVVLVFIVFYYQVVFIVEEVFVFLVEVGAFYVFGVAYDYFVGIVGFMVVQVLGKELIVLVVFFEDKWCFQSGVIWVFVIQFKVVFLVGDGMLFLWFGDFEQGRVYFDKFQFVLEGVKGYLWYVFVIKDDVWVDGILEVLVGMGLYDDVMISLVVVFVFWVQ